MEVPTPHRSGKAPTALHLLPLDAPVSVSIAAGGPPAMPVFRGRERVGTTDSAQRAGSASLALTEGEEEGLVVAGVQGVEEVSEVRDLVDHCEHLGRIHHLPRQHAWTWTWRHSIQENSD